ncbi:MAG TPA: hypothetical protein VFY10_10280 [Dehalococcoidia bacterium]|nr:hypothetical protein [Dehalococcoidia bacterium]
MLDESGGTGHWHWVVIGRSDDTTALLRICARLEVLSVPFIITGSDVSVPDVLLSQALGPAKAIPSKVKGSMSARLLGFIRRRRFSPRCPP